jgi:nucleotidyltransferase/DNA polymerase involved in DNA repair
MHIVLHLDMDAFYASIEQRDHPEYRGKPVIVGAPPNQRGVVATCSYEARRFGVHSAMPSRTAGRLCTDGIYVHPRMDAYAAESRQIMEILRDFTPLVEPVSIDEAFLDVTEVQRLQGSGPEIARKIKERIRRERALTASIGVAPNKFLAKLGSDLQKPDGLTVIDDQNKLTILAPLPVGKIWGVGEVTRTLLEQNGIRTIGDVQKATLPFLRTLLGNQAESLQRLANGEDDRPLEMDLPAKSIGAEDTFLTDINDAAQIKEMLLSQAEEVARQLRRDAVAARTVTLKLRYEDFTTLTRQATLAGPTQDEVTLYERALELLLGEWNGERKIRLIGISASNLTTPALQLELFDQLPAKRQKAAEAVDAIRSRFGEKAIRHLTD